MRCREGTSGRLSDSQEGELVLGHCSVIIEYLFRFLVDLSRVQRVLDSYDYLHVRRGHRLFRFS